MDTPFTVDKRHAGDGVVRLLIAGEVDRVTSDSVRTAIGDALLGRDVRELVVDLRHVGFLDAAGVRALLGGFQSATRHRCGYRVANAQGMVRHVLDLTRLSDLFRVSSDDLVTDVPARHTGGSPT